MSVKSYQVEYWLGELSEVDTRLDEAVADVIRIRNGPWTAEDLPGALTVLLEILKDYQRASNEVAELADRLTPAEEEEDDEEG